MRMSWDNDKARLAIADLCERAAKALREGNEDTDAATILECATGMLEGNGVILIDEYDCGLANANVDYECRDAAISAISAGKHPPDSLPGKLMTYVEACEKRAAELEGCDEEWWEKGKVTGALTAIEWIVAKR